MNFKITSKKNEKYLVKLILIIIGLIIFYIAIKIVVKKVEEAVIKGQNILTVSLSFNSTEIIILLALSIMFLIFIFWNNKKHFVKYIQKFLSWVIFTSISAILIYILIISPHLKKTSLSIILIILFSLYILYEQLKKE